jgi:hypothetical protein
MPFRFRKSFKIFPGVKINMSKGGVSFTVGTKGYHLNFSKRGVRQTVGLPGSGISETSYLVKNEPESETKNTTRSKKKEHDSEEAATKEEVEEQVPPRRRSPFWVILLGIIVIYFSAVVLGLIPVNFLSQVFHTLTEWTRSIGL